ncbi:glycosyltransferase family 4 protein [Hirschia baltica]|uniref:Glycosyl transferase group 1 n=1 Tax=Hirschia baltica (strain ATCC 49814 / DSM 5838 / IFAM 1418) TaxID=582402 RepID=C6XK29_HIRBI|nr:glycosyltransferase family 4 protein [Hirschia baltica]ACT59474.1 glycosyl transferase group 1 [Hirschia baltica ATCC 49814]
MDEKAIVLHSGMQHALHVALGYKLSNQLEYFATGPLYTYNDHLAKILGFSSVLSRMYSNRSTGALASTEIRSVSRFELLERIVKVLSNDPSLQRNIVHWRDRAIARHFAKNVPDTCTKIYSFPNVALEFFENAGKMGVRKILDLPIAHYEMANTLAKEEAERFPGFASTFTYKAPPAKFCERFAKEISLADRLVCGSEFVKSSFIDRGVCSKKMTVVKYGSSFEPLSNEEIDVRRKKLEQSNLLNILYVGQFSQRKGLSYLCETVKKVKENIPARFSMIGSFYGDRKWYEEYSDVIDQLIVRGSRHRVREEMLKADVLFFPTLFEGSALVVHEAVSMGLPVITTVNAGATFVGENSLGEILQIRDVESYSRSLVGLFEDHQKRAFYTNNCLQYITHAGWDDFYNVVPSL